MIWLIPILAIAFLCTFGNGSTGGSCKVANEENFKPLSREYLEVLRDRLGITIKEDCDG